MVGTPIGNLGDISYRAVEILKTVSLVACEDTRVTLKLLNHCGIHVPLLSCRSQNEKTAARKICETLQEGKAVAYCSDAGTPGLSDPGAVLVRTVTESGFTVIPIPGPSACTALISVAGNYGTAVLFEGFLSPKPGRRRARLRELLEYRCAFILCESPFRILKLLADIVACDPSRHLCIGREMTKIHEEYLRGEAHTLFKVLADRKECRGEYTVFVAAPVRNTAAGI
ncbi:putative 16S rRNA (cytidine1402-2'-O)-methyltransferase [Pillotina sp. SPG140]|jgi:16S rRNA (cytidine1402-2'-O)-methyltransferase